MSLALAVSLAVALPPQGDPELRGFRAVANAMVQPMEYSLTRTCFLSTREPKSGKQVQLFFGPDGAQLVTGRGEALKALQFDGVPSWSMHFPLVMSAGPWHYEERLGDDGLEVQSTLICNGHLDITKIRHSAEKVQCNVVAREQTERMSIPWLLAPCPGTRAYLADWFESWTWKRADLPGQNISQYTVSHEKFESTYRVGLRPSGLPVFITKVNSDHSSGSAVLLEFRRQPGQLLWMSATTRIQWSANYVKVDGYDIQCIAPSSAGAIERKNIVMAPGQLICDGRYVPESVSVIPEGAVSSGVPHVRVRPRDQAADASHAHK